MTTHALDSIVKQHDATLLTCRYPDRSIDGCVIDDSGEHFIVVDDRLDVQHMRFTIGHELGHIIDNSVGKGNKYSEQRASNISIHLLVPDYELKKAIEDGHNDIPTLCSIFGVPYHWMEERLKRFFKI